jgi:hypothetical protein
MFEISGDMQTAATTIEGCFTAHTATRALLGNLTSFSSNGQEVLCTWLVFYCTATPAMNSKRFVATTVTQAHLDYAARCADAPDEADTSLLPTMTEAKPEEKADALARAVPTPHPTFPEPKLHRPIKPHDGEKLTATARGNQAMLKSQEVMVKSHETIRTHNPIVATTYALERLLGRANSDKDKNALHRLLGALTAPDSNDSGSQAEHTAAPETFDKPTTTTTPALAAFVLATVGNPTLNTTTAELAVPAAAQPIGGTVHAIQEALAAITGVRVLPAPSHVTAVPPETQALLDKTPLKFGSDLECCVLVHADGTVTLRLCPIERVREAYAAFARNKDDPETPKYVRFQLNTVPAAVSAFTLCHIGAGTYAGRSVARWMTPITGDRTSFLVPGSVSAFRRCVSSESFEGKPFPSLSSSAFFAKPEYVVAPRPKETVAPQRGAKRAKRAKHNKDVPLEDDTDNCESVSGSECDDASDGYESDGGFVTQNIHYARRGKNDAGRVATDNLIARGYKSRFHERM